MAKAASWADTDADARKRGEQTGLDTLVVHALNDVNWLLGKATSLVTKLTREVDRLGSTVARLKLKGIDGGPHKRWMMWFNSMQREKPYLPLTCQELPRDGKVPEREPGHRCCMAVVSSCREMLG
jgi:hypothetical protein